MKTLLIYATYSSGTQQAADEVVAALGKHGVEVTKKEVPDVTPEELAESDLIILGSPSWDINGEGGQPHEHFGAFIEKTSTPLPGKKFAVFGLGDTAYPVFCGAVDHLEKFVQKLQGTLVIPSLRIDGYFFNPDEASKNIEAWTTQLVNALKQSAPTPSSL